MPNVLNEFTGDGVTKTFTFAMTGGYLNRDYVFFFTRPNDDLLNYTPYDDANVTWVGDFTIELSAPVPIGTTFVIVRSTPLSPLVDFQNTSRITEKNLDTATQQSIHIAAESSDLVGRLEAVVKSAKADAEAALAGAEEASDNATLAAQAAMGASAAAGMAQVAAENANTAAQNALQSAQDSEALALQAGNDASAAASLAQSAVAASATANQTAGAAVATANQASGTANSAAAVATEALSKAGAAESAAGTAVSTANSAASTAGAAASEAAQAVATANEAKSLIDEAVAGGVSSFNGRAGPVLPLAGDYDKAMVGLGAVDNTSDMDKPISTAVANALSGKASTAYVNTQLAAKADKTYVDTELNKKAASTTVDAQLAAKADTTYVNDQLALKASLTHVSNVVASSSVDDRKRQYHTGEQPMSSVTGLVDAIASIPTNLPKVMNCTLVISGTDQVTLYRAYGDMITIKGVVYQLPVATNSVTILQSAPHVYARVIGSVVSIYVDSPDPVFNNTYGQWVNPNNMEPYVGSAVAGGMNSKRWLVRSMFNENPVGGSSLHFSGTLTWDGQPAVVSGEYIVLLPGDVFDVVSTASIGFEPTGNRSCNHSITWVDRSSSQFLAVPGGVGLCLPTTVTLSVAWTQTVRGAQMQTVIARGTGGGNIWRPGAGSIDKTMFTIKRNY